MFIWAQLPREVDTACLLVHALEERVMFVPGASFYLDAPEANRLRLSFATATPEELDTGVARLARALARYRDAERPGAVAALGP